MASQTDLSPMRDIAETTKLLDFSKKTGRRPRRSRWPHTGLATAGGSRTRDRADFSSIAAHQSNGVQACR
jgi:hypothetical protein